MADNEYCQLVSILIPKYVKGQCTKAEGTFLGEHCAECPECRAKLVRAFEETQITCEKDDPLILRPKNLYLSQKEILFLSRPRNLKLSKKPGGKEIKQESNTDQDYVIDWKDSVLESRMRDNTGILFRDLRYKDVKTIRELDLSSSGSEKISDISALSVLTNLHSLKLDNNKISDISALGSLINLEYLSLAYNQISDISALSSLAKLEYLTLSYNQISDISTLRSLTKLRMLYLDNNYISDISALSSLTKLEILNLRFNRIRNYKPIRHLKSVVALYYDSGAKSALQSNRLRALLEESLRQTNMPR